MRCPLTISCYDIGYGYDYGYGYSWNVLGLSEEYPIKYKKVFNMSVSDKLRSLKVAIYIRVSTHWQVDKDSLQVQKRELIAYAQMVLGIQDYFIFEDAGYSAKNTDRPDYQEMMERLRSGEFSHLLVWKIDRISRNLLDFASMYEELKRLGVTFVSKNEQLDTSTAIGEAMQKIILVFAELERKMTGERVTSVMLSRAENGQWNGGRIPYGYKYDKQTKEFEPDPIESKVVRRIYELYEREQSLLYVTRYLNEHGVFARSEKQWTPTTISKILKNPFYIGHYRYNVTQQGDTGYKARDESEWIIFENHHSPIVDDVLFDRIQFLLKRNRRGGVAEGISYARKNTHIFAGIVRCGICGSNMSATLDRVRADGWRPSIYGCNRRRSSNIDCQNKYISDILVGPFVFNYIANIIRAKDSITKRTGLTGLEKKLLRGEIFSGVEAICPDGLQQMHDLLLTGVSGLEYRPAGVFSKSSESVNERDALLSRKLKHEVAMNRLKSLYLYGDGNLAEKDYIVERQRILSAIDEIDQKLSEFKEDEDDYGPLADDEFIEKASYFMMVSKLLKDTYVDYEKYIRQIDPSIPRSFIKSVIESIEATDGKITAIVFKNGIRHSFTYKK